MGVIVPNFASSTEDRTSGAQIIEGSLRFDRSKSQYLTRTPSSSGNRKTFTISIWIKPTTKSETDQHHTIYSAGGTKDNIFNTALGHSTGNLFTFNRDTASGEVTYANVSTAAAHRDPSAWYHFVIAVDTTQSTSTNRIKLYKNGVLQVNSSTTFPSQNLDLLFFNVASTAQYIGRFIDNSWWYADFYASQYYFIDGQALDPSYFGYTDPLTNTWRPKKYTDSLKEAEGNGNNAWNQEYTNSCLGIYFNGNATNSSQSVWLGRLRRTGSTSYASAVTFGTSTAVSLSSGDTFMWAYDESAAKLWVGKNGTWYASGDPANGTNPTFAGFPTDALLFKTLYSEDAGVPNGSDLYLTRITSGNASYSTPSGFSYWSGMNLNWRYGGGSTSSISRADYIPQRITGKVYFETTVHWTGSGGWSDYRIAGLSDEGNANINSFYLPFDGSAPIGQDQSGNGRNWTPVNFGGSNTLEKATGALPILNTDGGGKVARVGVRTDSNASSLVLAMPLVGVSSDFSATIKGSGSNKAITAEGGVSGSSAQSVFYGGSYLFDGSNDLLSTPSSSDFDFGTGDYTAEGWVYITSTSDEYLMSMGTTVGLHWGLNFYSTNLIRAGRTDSGGTFKHEVTYNFTANRWYHIAISRQSGTSRLFLDGVLIDSKADTDNIAPNSTLYFGRYYLGSLFLNGYLQDLRIYKGIAKYTSNFIPASTDPDILPDTPSGVSYSSNVTAITEGAVAFDGSGDYLTVSSSNLPKGSSSRTVEFFVYIQSGYSSWQNIFSYGSSSSGQCFGINVGNNDGANIAFTGYSSGDWDTGVSVRGYLNSWHHFAVTYDGTNVKIFVDGISLGSAARSLNTTGSTFCIGGSEHSGFGENFKGIISNFQVTDNVLYTSNFTPPTAPITSVANTKLLCCKSNSSAIAADVTPGTITANGNAAASNFNPFTVNINTVRGKQSGYCTWNPLDANSSGTLSNGNLQWASAANAHYSVRSSFSMKTGKWYAEGTVLVNTNSVGSAFGIALRTASLSSYTGDTGSWSYHCNGNKYLNGDSGSSFGIAYGTTVGNVVGLAFDADNGNLDAYCNGVYQGRVVSGLSSDDYFWMVNAYNWTWGINFGQKPFKFPPPAGFQPLALANTPRPTIVRPDQYVGIVTYTGNDSNPRSFANLGWKPDFIWIKNRSQSYNHVLFDSVRGAGGSKVLFSNRTTAEGGGAGEEGTAYGHISSFDNYGFTVNTGTTSDIWVNNNTENYVAWAWKAGGNSNTFNINDVGYATASAAGLTAGTITPTGASVNTKSGFSIITWTGTSASGTISHGLGKKPSLIIGRRRNGIANWCVYHISTGASQGLNLQSTDAAFANTNRFDGVEPTSTVFSVGTSGDLNAGDAIAYLWAEIPGFSKFGSYIGNNSTDGPVVVTGFRPRWIIIKCSSSSQSGNGGWRIFDTERDKINPFYPALFADDTLNEVIGSPWMDILSNGFKIRATSTGVNAASPATYIYAAFAETPSFNLYGGQANAR